MSGDVLRFCAARRPRLSGETTWPAPLAWQVLLDAVEQAGGRFLLTADHGNAEDMVQVGLGGADAALKG